MNNCDNEARSSQAKEFAVMGALLYGFPEKLTGYLAQLVREAPNSCDDQRNGLLLVLLC
jgi:hypothetical protein